jgi:hypothetical protein
MKKLRRDELRSDVLNLRSDELRNIILYKKQLPVLAAVLHF